MSSPMWRSCRSRPAPDQPVIRVDPAVMAPPGGAGPSRPENANLHGSTPSGSPHLNRSGLHSDRVIRTSGTPPSSKCETSA